MHVRTKAQNLEREVKDAMAQFVKIKMHYNKELSI